jgi:hypothetical protein
MRKLHDSTVYLLEDEEGMSRLLDEIGNRRI